MTQAVLRRQSITTPSLISALGLAIGVVAADLLVAKATSNLALLCIAGAAAITVFTALRPVYAIDAWILAVPTFAAVRVDVPGLPALSAARCVAVLGLVAAVSAVVTGRRARTAALALPAFGFVAAAAVSFALRPISAPSDASSFVDTIIVPFVAAAPFLIVRATRRDFNRHVGELVLVGTAIGVAAVYEHFTGWNVFGSANVAADSIYRATGPFTHAIILAALLSLCLVALVETAHRVRAVPARAGVFIAIAIVSAAAFFTYSRGPLIAAALAIAFLLVRRHRIVRVRAELIVLGVGLAIAGYRAVQSSSVAARVLNRGTIDTRLGLYDLAWDLFRDHAVWGVGVRGFGHAVANQLPPALAGLANWSAVDNAYLQALVEGGLVGAAFLAILVALSARAVVRARGTDSLERIGTGLILASGLMAFGFDAFNVPIVTAGFFFGLRLLTSGREVS